MDTKNRGREQAGQGQSHRRGEDGVTGDTGAQHRQTPQCHPLSGLASQLPPGSLPVPTLGWPGSPPAPPVPPTCLPLGRGLAGTGAGCRPPGQKAGRTQASLQPCPAAHLGSGLGQEAWSQSDWVAPDKNSPSLGPHGFIYRWGQWRVRSSRPLRSTARLGTSDGRAPKATAHPRGSPAPYPTSPALPTAPTVHCGPSRAPDHPPLGHRPTGLPTLPTAGVLRLPGHFPRRG